MGRLGRREPADDRHLQRYSLTTETMPDKPTPVVLGINWYRVFDRPVQDNHGAWWIVKPGTSDWSYIRGGHAICLQPPGVYDSAAWWRFYDQWNEGACVGFAIARMMTLLNRRRYDARRLYHEALKIDEWPGEEDAGTSVRAGCDVARTQGLVRVGRYEDDIPEPEDGIAVNRWARSVEEIAACLSPKDNGASVLNRGYVTPLNSWGDGYPHFARLALEDLDRLVYRENGEATVVVDR